MKVNCLQKFVSDESGAITVDWVVLTAALTSLGLAVIMAIDDQVMESAEYISDKTTESATVEWFASGS